MQAPMLKNPRNRAAAHPGCYDGCSCHNSRQTRRAGKKSSKRAEDRRWRREEGL
jgi:hypothetical protein